MTTTVYLLTAAAFAVAIYGVREIIREVRALKEYQAAQERWITMRVEVEKRKKAHKAVKLQRELLEAATADLLRAEGRLR